MSNTFNDETAPADTQPADKQGDGEGEGEAAPAETQALIEQEAVPSVEPSGFGLSDREKFNRFTERARKVLSLAQEEAQRFNHNYIGTEHLLLGLVHEGDGVAAQVLTSLNVELNRVRSAVEFIVGRGDSAALNEIGLTPRAKKVIELAVDEARRLNHHYIGTEHLLLGLVREGEGIAAGVLESLGVNLEKVRTTTIQVLAQSGSHGERPDPKHSKTPTIDQMGIDLTQSARLGKLDPMFGRESEIARVIQILGTHQRYNPALISEPGMGKTAIVEALAQRVVSGEVPDTLLGLRIISLATHSLISGSKEPVEFEDQLKKVVEEIRGSQDCIVFIDDVHVLVGGAEVERAMAAISTLKQGVARGELQCIAAMSLDEYRTYIEKDAALQRRFQKVIVPESTVEETIEILKEVRDRYELHHRLTISDEALKAAAEMASRYITGRFLPDKAIDLIDEAASRVRLQRSLAPLNLRQAAQLLDTVLREKEAAIQATNYDQAAELRDREVKVRDAITKLESGWQRDQGNDKSVVGEEDIAQIVSMWTGIPKTQIMDEWSARLTGSEEGTRETQPGATTSEPRIFISYSHVDEDVCHVLANELAGAGYNAWYDYRLQGGTNWMREIENRIRERRVFILLVSPEAMASEWVNDELELAMRLRNLIIPVQLRPTNLEGRFLGNRQVIDAQNRTGQEVASLLLAVLRTYS